MGASILSSAFRNLFGSFALAAFLMMGASQAHAQSTWNPTGAGPYNWNTPANWTGGIPNSAGATADLQSVLTAAQTDTLNLNVTLGTLNIGSSASFAFTLNAGTSDTLTMASSTGTSGASINETSANSDVITAPIAIADTGGLTISTSASGGTFKINGPIGSSTSAGNEGLILNFANGSTGGIQFSSGGSSGINNSGSITTGSGTGVGTLNIQANIGSNVGNISLSNAGAVLISGAVSNSGNFSVANSGTFTLGTSSGTATVVSSTGSITFASAGNITIQSSASFTGAVGNITFAPSGSANTLTFDNAVGSINNSGLVAFAGSSNYSVSIGNLFGPNVTGIIQNATGTLSLAAITDTLTNGFQIWNGELSFNATTVSNALNTIYLGNPSGGSANTLAYLNTGTGTTTITNPFVINSTSGTNEIESNAAVQVNSTITFNSNSNLTLYNGRNQNMTFGGSFVGASGASGDSLIFLDTATSAQAIIVNGLINIPGTITDSASSTYGAATQINGGVGSNVTAITQSSSSNPLTIATGSITVNSGGTTLTATGTGTSANLNVTSGVTGTGNLIITNDSSTASAIHITGEINNSGTITNNGTGAAETLSGQIGSNVQGITENSANSALTVTTGSLGLQVNSAGTTLAASAGTLTISATSTITGSGNLIVANDTTTNNAVTFSATSGAAINPTGTIVNAGTNSGSEAIPYVGTAVDGIEQNSNTSAFTITPAVGNSAGFSIVQNGTAGLTLTGGITGAGAFSSTGTGNGTVYVEAVASSVTGVTQNAASTLEFDNASASGSGTMTINAGTVLANNAGVWGSGAVTLNASSSATATLANNGYTVGNAINVGSGTSGTNLLTNNNGSAAVYSGAITMSGGSTLTISALGGSGASTTASGNVTGSGNLVLTSNSSTATVTLGNGSNTVNNAGTITNSGTGSATTVISNGIGSSVTGITENSAASGLSITGLVGFSGANTLTLTNSNSSGSAQLVAGGGFSGSGTLVLDNDSAINGGITLSTNNVHNTGTIINSGTGSGSTVISSNITTGVTGVTENSSTSELVIAGSSNSFAAPVTIQAGTLYLSGKLNSSSATVAVDNGGALAGTGTVTGAVTLNSGGAINMVDGQIGTLHIGSLTTAGGGTIDFDISTGSSANLDLLADAGSFTASGTTGISIANLGGTSSLTLTNGNYNLITSSTALNLANFDFSSNSTDTMTLDGKLLTLAVSSNNLQVDVTSPVLGSATGSFTSPLASLKIITGTSTLVTGTLTNTASSGSNGLNVSLSDHSTGTTGSFTGFSSSNPTTIAAGTGSLVTGTFTAGSVGTGTYGITNTDGAASPTTASVTGSVTVYNHAAGTLALTGGSPSTLKAIAGYGITSSLTLSNSGANNDNLIAQSAGSSNLVSPYTGTLTGNGSTALTGTLTVGAAGSTTTSTYTQAWQEESDVIGATPGTQSATATVTVTSYNHAAGTLALNGTPGTISAIAGYTAGTASLTLANTPANADNLIGQSSGSSGNLTAFTGTLAATGSTALTGSLTVGAAGSSVTDTFTQAWQEESDVLGATPGTQTSTVTVVVNSYSHSAASLSSTSVNLGEVHAGTNVGSESTTLTNSGGSTAAGLQITSLTSGLTGGSVGDVIAAGSSGETLSANVGTVSTGTINQVYTIGTEDQANVLGGTTNANQTFTITGNAYSGAGVWNTNGGGSWGTIASPVNWTAAGGTPGLDSSFKTTDSASFGSVTTSGGTATVTLGSDSPYLNAITFNNSSASYDIEQGAGGTGTINLDSSTGTATITDSAGNHTIGAPINLVSNGATEVASSSTLTINGVISDPAGQSMTITGPGTTVFNGANTYTGGTTVNAGATLLVGNGSGSATGSGPLSVAAGATLGGTGIINSSSFSIGGTGTAANVIVGNGTDTTSALTLTGSGSNSITNTTLSFNISAATPGQGNELSVGTSAIAFSGSILALNVSGTGIVPAYSSYVLIAGTGTNQYLGLTTEEENEGGNMFDVITGGLTMSFSPSLANTWYAGHSFLYLNTADGVDNIEVDVVPEPGTWALMLGGLAMLIFWQRKKNVRR